MKADVIENRTVHFKETSFFLWVPGKPVDDERTNHPKIMKGKSKLLFSNTAFVIEKLHGFFFIYVC